MTDCIGCGNGKGLCASCRDKLEHLDVAMKNVGLGFTQISVHTTPVEERIWNRWFDHLEADGKNPSEMLSLANQQAFLEIVQNEIRSMNNDR